MSNSSDYHEPSGVTRLKRKRGQHGLSKKRKILNIFSLPDEALIKITSFLTQEDTLSLLYSHRRFERACKVRLYKRIVICEKYQDHYFYDMCKEKGTTILSGWDNILKFFRMFYMKTQDESAVDAAKCVEELVSFNFLDRGRLDSYRFMSNSDLQNILHLRQFWSTVTNGFVNLKSFVVPKLSLEKVFILNPEIRSNLKKLSISTEDDLALGPLQNYDIQLPKLKILRLNLSESYEATQRVLDVITKLTSTGDTLSNDTLEELEFNGFFGKVDRDTEHRLRHLKLTNDVNLTSTFTYGFETGRRDRRVPAFSSSNGLADSESEFETDSENEIEGEKEEDYDPIFANLTLPYGENAFIEQMEADENENNASPHLKNVPTEVKFNGLSDHGSYYLSDILERLDSMNVKFLNIKKLVLSNFKFSRDEFEGDNLVVSRFRSIFPNLEDRVETLELRNIEHSVFHEDYRDDFPYFTTDIAPSFITALSDTSKTFKKLRKLVIYCSLNRDNVLTVLGMDKELIGGKEYNVNSIQLQQLTKLLEQTPMIEELVVYAAKYVHLKHFYRIIFNSPVKHQLTKLFFTEPVEIARVCRKVLNARIFRKFNHFKNLKILDDYYFGCSKKLVEHFIKTTRVDNYDSEDHLLNSENTEFFKDEFNYLYVNEVRKFFKLCPNLQQFTYYGYTFQREKVLI